MSTTLQKDFAPRRPPARIKVSTGEILTPSNTGSVAKVTTSTAGTVSALLALGFEISSGDAGSDGTWILRGPWEAGISYRQNDVVALNSKSYRAIEGGPNLPEPPGLGWAQVSVAASKATAILSGEGEPAAGVGVDGEYWLDVIGARLYGPKAAGSWGDGLALGGQASAGWNFHTRITTQAGILVYDLGRSGVPTDERLHQVTLGGIVLSYGAEQDFTISGSQITLAMEPGVTNLVVKAVI